MNVKKEVKETFFAVGKILMVEVMIFTLPTIFMFSVTLLGTQPPIDDLGYMRYLAGAWFGVVSLGSFLVLIPGMHNKKFRVILVDKEDSKGETCNASS